MRSLERRIAALEQYWQEQPRARLQIAPPTDAELEELIRRRDPSDQIVATATAKQMSDDELIEAIAPALEKLRSARTLASDPGA
jgi:hypothetical protein